MGVSKLEDYDTAAQAAERFGVTDSQVRRLAGQDRIQGAVKMAGAWFVPKDSWPEDTGFGRPPKWKKNTESSKKPPQTP